jgi:EAL domain-containing protein (putative c-di-GMP-specific phosphodiesterase class I)/DNA-binding SARP family transcriptional activator
MGDAPGSSPPGRRAELVLAYLAAEHHRVVTQEELADALWPDALPGSWSSGLRGVVTEVRRYLDEAGLEQAELLTVRGGYRLELPEDVVVDLDEAREELTRARALLDAGAGAEAAVHGARSASLAHLPFLPNYDGDWVDGIRRELESIRGRALEVEARGHHAAGDLAAAASAAERLVRVEPFSEAGHQLRIRLLGEAGDRAGAIRAYEHCRTVLAEELGVAPSAETEAALRAAREGGAARPHAASDPPTRKPSGSGGLVDLSVLVVEDHDFQRRTAVRVLRGLGVESVSEAADGMAALEILAGSAQPDVIICDIDMPGMDGIQFIRHVAERGLACAVVIASGLDTKVLEAVRSIGEGRGLQVLGAIRKPLTGRRLGELLASYRRQRVPPPSGPEVSVSTEEVVAALAEGQMVTLFEPIVDLAEARIDGAEAVGRWFHPDKGTIPPATYLPVLATEGLLLPYAEARLEDACAALRRSGASVLRAGIGLDVDARMLGEITLVDRFLETVRRSGAEPSQLTCEVTEQVLASVPPVALDAMTRLRVKGFGLGLDHFGARRQASDRVTHVPFTNAKVDGSLVSGVAADQQRLVVLEETFEAAESLGIPLTAEGCESEADFDVVVDMGFQYAQGSFLGPPLRSDELADLVGTWRLPAPGGGGSS